MTYRNANKFQLPFLGYGAGLRAPHIGYVLENKPPIDWFEIISENYMEGDASTLGNLEKIRENYPIVMHGVSLSIGTIDPIDSDYLHKLKALADRLQAPWISDHLCWTGIAHTNTHDLLPVPYTEEALAHIAGRVRRVQDVLERPILLENPSAYLSFSGVSMPEYEFIARLAEEADCGLLLDVNNVYVSAFNQRFDTKTYLDAIPLERVAQIHLAGHTHKGSHIVDTHSGRVCDEVWDMYGYVRQRAGEISTMIEWDEDLQDFPALLAESDKARTPPPTSSPLPDFSGNATKNRPVIPYEEQLRYFQLSVLHPDGQDVPPAAEWATHLEGFSADDQIRAYREAYRSRLCERVREDCPALRAYLGAEATEKIIADYVESTPSVHYNMTRYVERFPEFVANTLPQKPFAYELALWETAIPLLFLEKDGAALLPENVGEMTEETRLRRRPCVRIFAFAHNLHDYYRAVRQNKTPPHITQTKTYAALSRIGEKIYRFDVTEAEYDLLQRFNDGITLTDALTRHSERYDSEETDIGEQFAKWMEYRVFATA